MRALIIDSHQHFWHPDRGDYPWMTGEFERIRRPFSPEDLAPVLQENGVHGTVLVQTWSSFDESKRFLEIAEEIPFVKGVVGWVDLAGSDVAARIDELRNGPGARYLVGIRHQVHDEADPEWMLRKDVLDGLEVVQDAGLVYDLLIRPRELPATLEVVKRLPKLRFVIDHIAKPCIAENDWDPWHGYMSELGREKERVWCKLSGMVTEASWANWKAGDLIPYINSVLDIFGADRCMFGSDWPVCTLVADYADTKGVVEAALSERPPKEFAQVMGQSAVKAYGLEV